LEQLESRLVPSVLLTNKAAYAPGETAVFTGNGYQAGETVDLSRPAATAQPMRLSVTDGGGDLDA